MIRRNTRFARTSSPAWWPTRAVRRRSEPRDHLADDLAQLRKYIREEGDASRWEYVGAMRTVTVTVIETA